MSIPKFRGDVTPAVSDTEETPEETPEKLLLDAAAKPAPVERPAIAQEVQNYLDAAVANTAETKRVCAQVLGLLQGLHDEVHALRRRVASLEAAAGVLEADAVRPATPTEPTQPAPPTLVKRTHPAFDNPHQPNAADVDAMWRAAFAGGQR